MFETESVADQIADNMLLPGYDGRYGAWVKYTSDNQVLENAVVTDFGNSQGWILPSRAELDAYALERARTLHMTNTQNYCNHIITETYPMWKQLNLHAGMYGQTNYDTYQAEIAACITESNRVEDLIFDATTEAEMQVAYDSLNFPTLVGVTTHA